MSASFAGAAAASTGPIPNQPTPSGHSLTPSLSGLSLAEMTCPNSPARAEEKEREAPSPKTDAQRMLPEAFLLPNGHPDYLRLILTSKVYEVVEETPLTVAQNLSARLECNVLLKREDLQPVFSFKLRGAYNKMAHLDAKDRWKGVVACSAGNHAQGVAYSARKLKIPATIVMPQATPAIKHSNVSRLGGSVVLHGPDFDAAKEEASRLEKAHGLTNIPPFDDPYVIAGQGTIGMELLRQTDLTKLDAVFCTVGGGGLIAGIGAYIKRIAPHVRIIGAETYDACAMRHSLADRSRVQLSEVGLFADGAAVKLVGAECFRVASEVVDEVVLCSTDEICAAIKDVFEDTRSILEPAGALAVAALKKYAAGTGAAGSSSPSSSPPPERTYVAVASGANMDFDRLRFVAERAKLGEGKEALLAVTIPERPGAFARLVAALGPAANVSEFRYRFSDPDRAAILLGIEFPSRRSRDRDLPDILGRLQGRPAGPSDPASALEAELSAAAAPEPEPEPEPTALAVHDCSADELAKTHIRYLVGGRSGVADERLYMFEFPERRGALHAFLQALRLSPSAAGTPVPGRPNRQPAPAPAELAYNISLFHYRNQGGDVARVLVGIQCPDEEQDLLADLLTRTTFPFKDVTGEEVYRMFMRSES